MGNTNEAQALKSMAMPFPPYNARNPTLWFQQIESCFYCTDIKDDIYKCHILVSRLDSNVAEFIQDFLINNNIDGPKLNYSELKTRIIEMQKIKNNLEKQQIGDRKPSEFLKLVQQLAPKSFPTNLIRSIWISHMSPRIQKYLHNDHDMAVEKLAAIADVINNKAQIKESLPHAEKPQNENHCNFCKGNKKVILEVNCLKLCEALKNLEKPDT